MPWGVPVPDDPEHVMYVWFDALVNYISTTGWPDNKEQFEKWWPGVQVAGKDNLRQQSAMWQAMLLSAGLPTSLGIFIHGFITSDGKKMSKSLGNVVSPFEAVEKYGTDAVRYYLLREIPPLSDGDFSYKRMNEIYQSELANELGNLLNRLTTIAAKDGIRIEPHTIDSTQCKQLESFILEFRFDQYISTVWESVRDLNKEINIFEPWNKSPEERNQFLVSSLNTLYNVGYFLAPVMPITASTIMESCEGSISKSKPLFPRLS